MNRYFGIATVLALSLLVCFSVGISIAQEEGTEYSYGTVRDRKSTRLNSSHT